MKQLEAQFPLEILQCLGYARLRDMQDFCGALGGAVEHDGPEDFDLP